MRPVYLFRVIHSNLIRHRCKPLYRVIRAHVSTQDDWQDECEKREAEEEFGVHGLLDVVSMLNTPKFLSERAGMYKRFVNLTRIQPVRSLCQKSGLSFQESLEILAQLLTYLFFFLLIAKHTISAICGTGL